MTKGTRRHRAFLLCLGSILVLPASFEVRAAGQELEPGVTLRLYQVQNGLDAIPVLAPDQTPNVDRLCTVIDFSAGDFAGISAPMVSVVRGFIDIAKAGQFKFRLTSDDGSRLTLDDQRLIDHDGRHGVTAMESRPVQLDAGRHELLVEHFDQGGNRALKLEWQVPGTAGFSVVPAEVLRTEKDLTRVTSPGFKRVEGARRPGDGSPVAGVHPGWELSEIRPGWFEPMVGAMAFLPDGRLVVGTFHPKQRDDRSLPDIESKDPDKLYALSGVETGDPSSVEVREIASGLFEPCGMCVVGDDLYVSHRKAITRLRDMDGDGYFETQENVAEGWEGWNYHQFVFGLVHREGKLYATLSTAMAPPKWEGMQTNAAPNGPMRGGILEVDLSSGEAYVIAGGTRAPNGIGLGPEGSLVYLDNQGAWMPTSQLSEVIPGRFYGHYNWTNFVPKLAQRFPDGGHPSVFCDRPRTPAAVLLPHNEVSNSPTQPQLIKSGMFAGQMFVGDLTAGGIRRIFLERVNGQLQGAVFRFTQGLESGVNRLIWGPDGALYAAGIGAKGNWNWRGTTFGLQRLAPTGRVAFEMLTVRAMPDGFEIVLTKPVDRDWLADVANYTVKQWRYEPTGEYGGPKLDSRELRVKRAIASESGRTVRLRIEGLQPGHCVYIRTDPTAIDGERIWSTEAWYTLNAIPGAGPIEVSTLAGMPIRPNGVGRGVLPPADAVTLIGAGSSMACRYDNAQRPQPSRTQDELTAGLRHVEVGMGTGDLVSNTVFGDCRLHIEWYCPAGGVGQLAANSGVFLQDRYEIQVLGIAGGDPENEAGAIYGVKAPDRNASTGPGTWQAYDIWFRAPRFADAVKTQDARMTVYWNRTLVHDDVAVPRPTGSRRAGGESADRPIQLGRLRLQDHSSEAVGPVRYRNVWIAPLERLDYEAGSWIDLLEDMTSDDWLVRGGEASFRLEDGTLIGTTRPNTPNTFYATARTFADFELLYEARVDPELNSGVQIRSHIVGGLSNRSGGLRGYQIEIDPSPRAYSAGIYDERRRGWLHPLQDMPYARRAFRPAAWNAYRVVAQGPVIRTWINGVPAASVFDAMTPEGHLGFQVHGVGSSEAPLEVRFRNIRIRELTPRRAERRR